jgi:hypothetical protein
MDPQQQRYSTRSYGSPRFPSAVRFPKKPCRGNS